MPSPLYTAVTLCGVPTVDSVVMHCTDPPESARFVQAAMSLPLSLKVRVPVAVVGTDGCGTFAGSTATFAVNVMVWLLVVVVKSELSVVNELKRSTGVSVGSLAPPTAVSSVKTLLKFEPATVP